MDESKITQKSQQWIIKYAPENIDEYIGNHNSVKIFKNMAKTKLYTHTVLRGNPGTGKRTLIHLFLKHINAENVYFIYDYKQIYSIIEKKTNDPQKWFVFLNISRFPSQFYISLYEIFSLENVTCIIIDTKENNRLDSRCIVCEFESKTQNDLIKISNEIGKKINTKWDQEFLKDLCVKTNCELYLFIQYLQSYYFGFTEWFKTTQKYIDCNKLLFIGDLKDRFREIKRLENNGHSHIDIAIYLYEYAIKNELNVDIVKELGLTILNYEKRDHNKYQLYSSIYKIKSFSNDLIAL